MNLHRLEKKRHRCKKCTRSDYPRKFGDCCPSCRTQICEQCKETINSKSYRQYCNKCKKEGIVTKCAVCSKTFKTIPVKGRIRKTCSDECFIQFRELNIQKIENVQGGLHWSDAQPMSSQDKKRASNRSAGCSRYDDE